MRRLELIFLVLFSFSALALMPGCGGDTASRGGAGGSAGGSTADDPVTDTTTNATVDNDFIRIGVEAPSGKSATLHKYGESWDTTCEIGFNDDPSDIICVLEMQELDLYAFDETLILNYNFPKDLCRYVSVNPYYFYQKLAGYGPSAVDITVTTVGLSTVTVLNDATDRTTGVTAELVDGELACTANYTNPLGFVANCCQGEYILTKDQDGTVTTETADWGGLIGSCLAGPAVTTQERDGFDFPMVDLIDMVGIGLNRDYEISSPLSQGYFTNLYIANYLDVTASFPGASADEFPGGIAFDWSTAPTAAAGAEINANPWYEFDCLDEADDYIHRVRVMVRAWSTKEQYGLGVSGAFDTGIAGTEEVYFEQQYLLDLYGWFTTTGGRFGAWDLLTEYPGDSL